MTFTQKILLTISILWIVYRIIVILKFASKNDLVQTFGLGIIEWNFEIIRTLIPVSVMWMIYGLIAMWL